MPMSKELLMMMMMMCLLNKTSIYSDVLNFSNVEKLVEQVQGRLKASLIQL